MMRAEVVQVGGYPVFRVNGELQTGFAFCTVAQDLSVEDRGAAARRIAEFRDAGIHYYTFGIGLGAFLGQKSFWNGPGLYEDSAIDDIFQFVISIDKDARILPRVAVDAPPWWKETHLDEVAVGWSADRGFFREEWLQSYSSISWRRDAGEALREFVRRAEQRYSDNIYGYHICAEASHEWSYGWWGTLHDYGPAQVAGFREWLKERHEGDVTRLRESWRDGTVNFETAQIPSGESRKKGDSFEYFDPSKGKQRIEYLEYHSQTVADAIRHFASISKEASGRNKLCGVFYWYYFFGENALLLDVGHRALARVLASPDIDFIACPYNYRERQAGGVAIPQAVGGSIRLSGKVLYVEDDTRTSLAPPGTGWGQADNLRDSIEILKRNCALALTAGSSLWWMEQSPGWFSDPEILRTINALEGLGGELIEKIRGGATPGCPEIAVFVSDESARYMRYNTALIEPLINTFCVEHLPRLGAPYDVFMVSDMERLITENLLDGVKLVVFLNTPFLDEQQRKIIREKIACNGRTVLWMCCPGYVSEKGLSTENVSSLTGIELAEEGYGGRVRLAVTDFDDEITKDVSRNLLFGSHEPTGPLFWCADKNAKPLGELYCMPALDRDWRWRTGMLASKTGLAVKEMKGWRSVWCGVPGMPSSLLRGVAKTAGVHLYLETDDVVYANALLSAVHARYAGVRCVALPRVSSVRDAMTGKVIAKDVKSFEVRLERGQTGLWLLES